MGNENSKATQCKRIVDYMNKFGSITQHEASDRLGVMRLASRISELRKKGFIITGEMIVTKNRYGEDCRVKRYRMAGEDDVL